MTDYAGYAVSKHKTQEVAEDSSVTYKIDATGALPQIRDLSAAGGCREKHNQTCSFADRSWRSCLCFWSFSAITREPHAQSIPKTRRHMTTQGQLTFMAGCIAAFLGRVPVSSWALICSPSSACCSKSSSTAMLSCTHEIHIHHFD